MSTTMNTARYELREARRYPTTYHVFDTVRGEPLGRRDWPEGQAKELLDIANQRTDT
jgi:hypothetical protein